jgi:glutamyl-tRNA synthetase
MLRFAPSPTGDLHLGNLRVALINWVVAQQKGEPFVVRIEDTDKERNIPGKDKEILEILKLFGIEPAQIFYQSQNSQLHRRLAEKLVEEGKAYPCFCTPEEIAQEREMAKIEHRPYRYSGKCRSLTPKEVARKLKEGKPYVIRLKKPEEPIKFTDKIKGEMEFTPFEVDDFIILRSDGTPTYNFACSVDDMATDISLVIRGEDHLSNTPKQIHIRRALGYPKEIEYAHLPIILNQEGKKLSKREKHFSVKWLLEEGYLPEAIANYLLLLGNTLPKEVFTLPEAVEFFQLEKISKAPAKFDIEKLNFLNRQHLKKIGNLTEKLGISPDLEPIVQLYRDEVTTLKELKEKISKIFSPIDPGEFGEEVKTLKKVIQEMGELPEDYNLFKKEAMERSGLKGKKFFMPLRLLLIGEPHGPEIRDLYSALRPLIPQILEWR